MEGPVDQARREALPRALEGAEARVRGEVGRGAALEQPVADDLLDGIMARLDQDEQAPVRPARPMVTCLAKAVSFPRSKLMERNVADPEDRIDGISIKESTKRFALAGLYVSRRQ